MKRRSIAALLLVTVVAAAVAATTSGATKKANASSITVWLQTDAQSGWADLVASVNQKFQSDHPGTTVNIQYQNWGDHLQKFDATLAGGGGPDVIEMGNTEMTKYMAAGAFADLSSAKSGFDNSANWLKGLAASGVYKGKTYGVPYYAGSRVVTYRSDLFKKAGISKLPNSTAAYAADAQKLMAKNAKKGFSPIYIAGTDWYFAMGFVFDYGGGIATQVSGKWKGLLTSPKSIAGLTAYKNFFAAASRASKTTDESHPNPYDVYAQGQAASMIGPSWYTCCVGAKYKGATAQFVMPGHVAGHLDAGLPRRLRPRRADHERATRRSRPTGSRTSRPRARRRPCRRRATSRTRPTCSGISVNERAASRSWFVPTAKHWVDVENGNILRNMLAQILTGKLSVKQAAQSASDNIASVLNQP